MQLRNRVFQLVLVLFAFCLFANMTHATDILIENVEVDVGNQAHVRVELVYRKLTAEKISYLVPHKVQDFNAYDSYGQLNCELRMLDIGTEFLCMPNAKENYSVTFTYKTEELVEKKERTNKLTFSHSIVDPTKTYKLKITLPEGHGVLETNETNLKSISPPTGIVGSTGRKITVEWILGDVKLGETLYFTAYYENLGFFSNFPIGVLVPIVAILLVGGIFFFINYSKKMRRREGTIASFMPALIEDEQNILRFIIEHNRECTQKKIVKELNFSKAKASRLIQDLESRNLIKKRKKGRTNIIKIEREIGNLKDK